MTPSPLARVVFGANVAVGIALKFVVYRAALWWTTAYVAAWGLFTMVRGAILERPDRKRFYPDPVMDAQEHGYARGSSTW